MKKIQFLALFLISIAGISYELYVMRIFSVGNWSNFGAFVISAALLGICLSGIILTFIRDWLQSRSEFILFILAISLPFLMAAAVVLAQQVPFNPVFMASDSKQFWFIGLYYIIYGAPFFVIGAYVGVSFTSLSGKIHWVYFWNMIGSGVGGIFIILFMFLLPPRYLLIPILCLTIVAAVFSSFSNNKKISFPKLAALVITSVGSILLIVFLGNIRISDRKDISYLRRYPSYSLAHHSYGPGGEYHVYASKYFHFFPGLSDNAYLNISKMPSQPYWGLFIDGSGPIGIMGSLKDEEKAYMDYLPMAAPYTMLSRPEVLLVRLSGGINAQLARYNNARKIDIVEPSPEMIHLLKDDANISQFNGRLLDLENIRLMQGEGRSYCLKNKNAYDLIEISLVDSVGLTNSGGYAIYEDFKYTVEAFKEYFYGLKEDGILSITVWDSLNPPRNVLRLLNTIILAMKETGMTEPEKNMYSFGLLRSTSTILVKKGAFSSKDLSALDRFVNKCSFELFYSPNAELHLTDMDKLLVSYRNQFEGKNEGEETLSNSQMYINSIPRFFNGEAEKIEKAYIFDIRPMTDSRPYYTGYLKINEMPMYMRQIREVTEEWGYLLLFAMLIQACIFGLVVILVPVIGQRKILNKNPGSTLGVILYYAGLGLGYMLIEIFLIQRLAVFLSNPTYSTSIVITAMLIFSALGNLTSGRFKKFRSYIVPAACILTGGCFVFYILGMDSFLASFISSSMAVRILTSILIIAPPAFFMGVPYPNGLDSLQENKPHLLPWAWGMNGGLSLVGSAMARILSVSSGFPLLLMIGIGIYVMVGILFPVNYSQQKSIFKAEPHEQR